MIVSDPAVSSDPRAQERRLQQCLSALQTLAGSSACSPWRPTSGRRSSCGPAASPSSPKPGRKATDLFMECGLGSGLVLVESYWKLGCFVFVAGSVRVCQGPTS
jgi:hypothetical protein